jgi:SpoVK/Ycf46/Vps4 family AAA+-type ATPase
MFIDEIDFMAKARSGMGAQSGSSTGGEDALIQMLTIMNKLQSGDLERELEFPKIMHLIVIAATNVPANLDGALMRRFDLKIFFDVPLLSDYASMLFKSIGGNENNGDTHVLTKHEVKEAVFFVDYLNHQPTKSHDDKRKRMFADDVANENNDAFWEELAKGTNRYHEVRTMRTGANAKLVARHAAFLARAEMLEQVRENPQWCHATKKKIEKLKGDTEDIDGEKIVTQCFDNKVYGNNATTPYTENLDPPPMQYEDMGATAMHRYTITPGFTIAFWPIFKKHLVQALQERLPDSSFADRQISYDYAKQE